MSLRRVQGRRVDSDRCKRLKSAGAGSRGTRWGKFGLFPREAEAHSLGRGLVTGGQHPCVLVEADWSFICGGATGSWKWRETNLDSYILDDPGPSCSGCQERWRELRHCCWEDKFERMAQGLVTPISWKICRFEEPIGGSGRTRCGGTLFCWRA
ncbi:hypothetical protein BDV98DRAFT_563570 [Pterulicium gracile]|uniref:Uncharacterized protein n=1 Tax=Pterulicium gracile TaxID=1884261 RepID=A0A5C3QRV6_9AGAR|nr:hypothetical protein BDV98DRAFT_563570 [Pterula gracilis]